MSEFLSALWPETPDEREQRLCRNAKREQLLKYWHYTREASTRAAGALASAFCETDDDARQYGEQNFRRLGNCGRKTVREIGLLIGGWARWEVGPMPGRQPEWEVVAKARAALGMSPR